MMLSISRKIPQATSSMKGESGRRKVYGVELYNKTLDWSASASLGRSSQIVRGFEDEGGRYDPYLSPEVAEKKGVELVSLDDS